MRQWTIPALYVARVAGGLGTWTLHVGMALFLTRSHGSEYVVLGLLLQSIPSVLLVDRLRRLMASVTVRAGIVGGYLLLAVACLALGASPGVVQVYVLQVCFGLIAGLLGALLTESVRVLVPPEKTVVVHTRTIAIWASTLAFAPLLSGFVSETLGHGPVFVLAAGFYVAAALVNGALDFAKAHVPHPRIGRPPAAAGYVATFRGNRVLVGLTVGHLLFSAATMTRHAVEYGVYDVAGLTTHEIAAALSAWGVGNLLAFLTAALLPDGRWRRVLAALGLAAALVVFLLAGRAAPIVGAFVLGGLLSAVAMGDLRGLIGARAGERSLDLWILIARAGGLLQLAIYGAGAVMLQKAPWEATVAAYLAIILVYAVHATWLLGWAAWPRREAAAGAPALDRKPIAP